ncbi:ComF family protein [Chitinophaga qingshengii]|uniref:ComF family protein n=1 Tax=Chitinophaga qingshengii TaxID=1569794 RepID=A0ABR7TW38_9BACT|nr:ComF family protein [Chitinophaga qingshengii]MBC9933599.1 ComF family protein [Chitinophaga qingshengii]
MFTRLLSPLVNLFYPHCCEICGQELLSADDMLCIRCHDSLPLTGFQYYADNPVTHIFHGRMPVVQATAVYYYSQTSGLQQLIHQFKYHQRQDIAGWLGRQMGYALRCANWTSTVDYLVPVPLFPGKEKQRGYNQAALLAGAMGTVVGKPLLSQALRRVQYTGTQTRKSRTSRWENVKTVFEASPALLTGRHVLLVDDVITTGATTEAAGQALLQAGATVSICCLAWTCT